MIKRFGLALIVGTLVSSCGGGMNEEPIRQVDSLIQVVNEAEQQLKLLDPKVYEGLLDTVKADVDFIQSHYPDTMDLGTAVKVDYYRRTLKSVRKYTNVYVSQTGELTYTNSQLSGLKKDLESEILDPDSFMEIFPAEKNAVSRHKESVVNIKAWYESIESSYERRKPGIDSLITYIKEHSDK